MSDYQASENPAQFVTFYSYKGGTGRSMLLANVAWLLASNGERVLVIDWDLEAPGIHRYFHPFLSDKTMTSTQGLIDALSHFTEAAVSGATSFEMSEQPDEKTNDVDWYKPFANLQSYSTPIHWNFEGRGKLDLIGAGQQGPLYGTKVNLFDWHQFYSKFAGREFLATAKEILKDKYDYVLIDSRTGVSDTSGICTMEMPDTLVVCFTLNNQSIEGSYAVAAGASQSRSLGNQLTVMPIPTRVDPFESERVDLGRELARMRFSKLVPMGKLPLSSDENKRVQQYWGDVEVPYVPKYAYEEGLACFSDTPHLKSSVLTSAEQVAKLLRGTVTEMPSVPDDVRSRVQKQFARKPYLITLVEEYADQLSARDLNALRKLVVRLVQVAPTRGAGAVDVPCSCPLSDFSDSAEHAMLDLAKDHGLVVYEKLSNGTENVILADERLILGWPRLTEWIDSDREFLAWLPQLTLARKTWVGSGMEQEDLLTGTSLTEATKWLAQRRDELRASEIQFIERCQENAELLRLFAISQATQAERVRTNIEEKDRQIAEVSKAYDELTVSYQRRNRLTVPLTIISLALVLLTGYMVWHHMHRPAASPTIATGNAPDNTAKPDTDDTTSAKPTDGIPVTPDILFNSADLAKACTGVSVSLYTNSIAKADERAALLKLWGQGYGMKTQMTAVGSRAQRANSIWYGSNVPPVCWKAVAFSLSRAGYFVSDLGEPGHDSKAKENTIEVGYAARALAQPPLTSQQLLSTSALN